jgi:PAS domain S-box-containing protein
MEPAWTLSNTAARLRALARPGRKDELAEAVARDRAADRVIDRATGLLAGRLGCRLLEAQGHLVRLATEQGREVAEVAAEMVEMLDVDRPIMGHDLEVSLARVAAWPPLPADPGDGDLGADSGIADRPADFSIADRPADPGTADRPLDRDTAGLRDRLATEVDADAVIVMGVEADGSLRIMGSANVPARSVSQWQRLPPQVNTTAMAAVNRGRAVWLPDVERARQEFVLIGDSGDRWASRAWLPVRDGPRVVGAVGVYWLEPHAFDVATRRTVARIVAGFRRRLRAMPATAPLTTGWSGWLASVQSILDMVPGSAVVLTPIRAAGGEIVDYLVEAVSREAVDDLGGRRGVALLGQRIAERYPAIVDSDVWQAYEQVLADGDTREVGPFRYSGTVDGVRAESLSSVRVSRLGAGLLITWLRHDGRRRQTERVTRTERLGNLGWYELDLVTGQTEWSEQVYRIFGTEPAGGPLSMDEIVELILPDDTADWARAMTALIERGEPMDLVYRVDVRGSVKYLRMFGEAVRDTAGRVLRLYGMVQDVTAREEARERLTEAQRQLAEQRRSLDAEHRLTVELQHIILPVPDEPVDLPGMRVAVRYLPAEHAARIGGDWYHAAELPSGQILLAVGDVAGHGLRAAATMAQLRHALAALAVTTTAPGELLRLLNQVLVDSGQGATATAVVARFDPATQSLTWAQAGHPAPVMARRGVPGPLPRPRGLLLGAIRDAVYDEATVPMTVGDLLLLYTDGLVERRGRSIDEGLAQVMDTVAEAISIDPAQPLAQLLGLLRQANPDDDTCVVAARPLIV